MDVYTRFRHLTNEAFESPSSPDELIQISVKVKADYVYLIDRLSNQLKISRTELINHLIKGALPEAVRAYYEGENNNPLENMDFNDFLEGVLSGDYLFDFRRSDDSENQENLPL